MNLLDLPRNILLRIFTSMPLIYFTDATTTCKKINNLFRYYLSNIRLSESIQSSQYVYLLAIVTINGKILGKFGDKISNHLKTRTRKKIRRRLNKFKQRNTEINKLIEKDYSNDLYLFEYFILNPDFSIDLKNMDQYNLACRCLHNKNHMIAKFAGFHDLPYEYTNLAAYKHGSMKAGRTIDAVTKNLLKYAVKYDYELPWFSLETYEYAIVYGKTELADKHDVQIKQAFGSGNRSSINSTTVKLLMMNGDFMTSWMVSTCVRISDKHIIKICEELRKKGFNKKDEKHARNRMRIRKLM